MRLRLPVLTLLVALGSPIFVGAEPAAAASGRVVVTSIGLNVPIVKVAVKNGRLQIGSNPRVAYVPSNGDPVCDQNGSTPIVMHAWRSGPGAGDRLGELRRGNKAQVGGCSFTVVSNKVVDDNASIKQYSRPGGPPSVALITCKANNYDFNRVVVLRKDGSNKPFG